MSQPPDPNTKLGSWEGHAFRPFSQIQKITQNLHNTQLNEKKQQQQQQQPSAPIAVKSNDHGREHQVRLLRQSTLSLCFFNKFFSYFVMKEKSRFHKSSPFV
jgi:hypothetical protein